MRCKVNFLFAAAAILLFHASLLSSYDSDSEPVYDYSAYTECQVVPEGPLYGGSLLKGLNMINGTFFLENLDQGNKYCFSIWARIRNSVDAVLVRASLETENEVLPCIGTVIARQGCWSFMKGGFELSSPSKLSKLFVKSSNGTNVTVQVDSASLQPFTEDQWKSTQEMKINEVRKGSVIVHVADSNGIKLSGASVTVEQVSKDFLLGSAIDFTIINNIPYQKWFADRFNVAVFENELKWQYTEPIEGQVNYNITDQMLEFLRANGIVARGHSVHWEIMLGNPTWVRQLEGPRLRAAANSRIESLMSKYRGEFIHWDVNNEEMHYDFFKHNLHTDATLEFFKAIHQADPLARLFINEYSVVETCSDDKTTADAVITRMRELHAGGATMEGIGLQSHFGVPNPPLMRGILDKLATLELPIWLTEVDITQTVDHVTQAKYLEVVLREGFSHPAVDGIVLWTALSHLNQIGCFRMCLTNDNFENLPAGDVVDSLLKEWQTGVVVGETDEEGVFMFDGYFGEYEVTVKYGYQEATYSFSLSRGQETIHWTISLDM